MIIQDVFLNWRTVPGALELSEQLSCGEENKS